MITARKAKKPRPADVSRAKGYIDRAAAIITQQKELGADLSDICTEAKQNAGLDPTVIRFAARESLIEKSKRTERDEKRAQYLHAMGLAIAAVESGEVSARQSAKIYGIGKSSLYKELAVREVSTDHRVMGLCDLGIPMSAREMTADDLGDPLWVVDKPRAQFREKVRAISASVKVQKVGAGDPRPEGTSEIDLTIPIKLDRRHELARQEGRAADPGQRINALETA